MFLSIFYLAGVESRICNNAWFHWPKSIVDNSEAPRFLNVPFTVYLWSLFIYFLLRFRLPPRSGGSSPGASESFPLAIVEPQWWGISIEPPIPWRVDPSASTGNGEKHGTWQPIWSIQGVEQNELGRQGGLATKDQWFPCLICSMESSFDATDKCNSDLIRVSLRRKFREGGWTGTKGGQDLRGDNFLLAVEQLK